MTNTFSWALGGGRADKVTYAPDTWLIFLIVSPPNRNMNRKKLLNI